MGKFILLMIGLVVVIEWPAILIYAAVAGLVMLFILAATQGKKGRGKLGSPHPGQPAEHGRQEQEGGDTTREATPAPEPDKEKKKHILW